MDGLHAPPPQPQERRPPAQQQQQQQQQPQPPPQQQQQQQQPQQQQQQQQPAAPSVHLLTLPEVLVFKVPPMQGASGHRAADWNLDKPALTGELRLISRGDKIYVNIMQVSETLSVPATLFASCPIKLDPDASKPNSRVDFFLQPVTDSSRYFVARVEDEATGRRAYVGIGFAERQSAFDLRAALDDELKRIARGEQGGSGSLDGGEEGSEDAGAAAPKVDRSLKEGETIKVNLKVLGKNKKGPPLAAQLGKLSISAPPSAQSGTAAAGGGLSSPPSALAAPPPARPAPLTASSPAAPAPSQPLADEDPFGDEAFGDFQS